jgi:hypothetical protein
MNRTLLKCLSLAAGGSILVLQGCDPSARDTVLGGVESAANGLAVTFISAFFQTLTADADAAVSTVKAIMHHASAVLG